MLEKKELLELRAAIKKRMGELIAEMPLMARSPGDFYKRRAITTAMRLMRPIERSLWILSQQPMEVSEKISSYRLQELQAKNFNLYCKHFDRLNQEMKNQLDYGVTALSLIGDLSVMQPNAESKTVTALELYQGYQQGMKMQAKEKQKARLALTLKKRKFLQSLNPNSYAALKALLEAGGTITASDLL